jgi:hypothetical protein
MGGEIIFFGKIVIKKMNKIVCSLWSLQNNRIFDVVNFLNLYYIFMNMDLIIFIRLIILILFKH